MDIQHLLDRLEALLSDSRRLGGKLIVDAQRSWDLIDQMRISIPEEVKRAQRINQERDRIMAQAKEESSRIIELARKEAAELTQEHVIAQQAQELAESIAARARRDAEAVQREADEYVLDVLQQLEADLGRTLTVVRNGVEKVQRDLKSRRSEQTEEQPPVE
jgi:vacuolar-type H+-ATPase subunit H